MPVMRSCRRGRGFPEVVLTVRSTRGIEVLGCQFFGEAGELGLRDGGGGDILLRQ